jgi:hypothetical protein
MLFKQYSPSARVCNWGVVTFASNMPNTSSMTAKTYAIQSGYDIVVVGEDHQLELGVVDSKKVDFISAGGRGKLSMESGEIYASWIVGKGGDMLLCEQSIKYRSYEQWCTSMTKLMEMLCGVKAVERVVLSVKQYTSLDKRVQARLRMLSHYKWYMTPSQFPLLTGDSGSTSAGVHSTDLTPEAAGADLFEYCKWLNRCPTIPEWYEEYFQGSDETRQRFLSGLLDQGAEVTSPSSTTSGQRIITRGGVLSGIFRKMIRELGIEYSEEETIKGSSFMLEGRIRFQVAERFAHLPAVRSGVVGYYKFKVMPVAVAARVVTYTGQLHITTQCGLTI